MPAHLDSIKKFLQSYRGALTVVARRIKESFEELENTIWVIVSELEKERDSAVDLENETDGAEILRRINRAADKFRRKNLNGFSLNQTKSYGDGNQAPSLLDSIRASDYSDPLEALQKEEAEAEQRSKLRKLCATSYSQYSAYIVLLINFEKIKSDVAAHLAVTAATLKRRIQSAQENAKVQPSLFDRIVAIHIDFLPPQRPPRPKLPKSTLKAIQYSLRLTQNC